MNEENLLRKIQDIHPVIEKYCSSDMRDEPFFVSISKSALMKAFEFAKLLVEDKNDKFPFFRLSSLRGICEDYIDVVFLSQLESCDRDAVAKSLMYIQFHELLAKQTAFFSTLRPFQPTIRTGDTSNVGPAHAVLKEVATRTNLWTYSVNRPMQTVFHRAQTVGLGDFYKFYYAFTSEMVHFSPRVLLRFGWGEDSWRPNFSVANFADYYREVGQIYSLVLLIQMIRSYSKIADIPSVIATFAVEVEAELNLILRWPEPITFEELNKRGPSEFIRLMMKVVHELKKKHDDSNER